MHNFYEADFRHNFFTLKTPQNIYPSWRKNRTKSHFSKPNFDMQGPICCKSYNFNGYPQLFIFVLVQKNIYSLSAFCTRLLTSFPAEIWFFKISDRGCRTKGPLPNLGRLTVPVVSLLLTLYRRCGLAYNPSVGGWSLGFLYLSYRKNIFCKM
jgi:hypothetical protein